LIVMSVWVFQFYALVVEAVLCILLVLPLPSANLNQWRAAVLRNVIASQIFQSFLQYLKPILFVVLPLTFWGSLKKMWRAERLYREAREALAVTQTQFYLQAQMHREERNAYISFMVLLLAFMLNRLAAYVEEMSILSNAQQGANKGANKPPQNEEAAPGAVPVAPRQLPRDPMFWAVVVGVVALAVAWQFFSDTDLATAASVPAATAGKTDL